MKGWYWVHQPPTPTPDSPPKHDSTDLGTVIEARWHLKVRERRSQGC